MMWLRSDLGKEGREEGGINPENNSKTSSPQRPLHLFAGCTGTGDRDGGKVFEDGASSVISLSDLEQSETFLNIISPMSSVTPSEGSRDLPKTIPIR